MTVDLAQAKALSVECVFSPEECERVLVAARRDMWLARCMLRAAAAINRPPLDAIGEICADVRKLTGER
jgi:hypothetical protein